MRRDQLSTSGNRRQHERGGGEPSEPRPSTHQSPGQHGEPHAGPDSPDDEAHDKEIVALADLVGRRLAGSSRTSGRSRA